ncbi:hypothetical protein MKJ01_18195 [Chryseobacterium sp. SSA4.19]|uniref:hypothetical protein n=1 Tax=Chryseobacterium sp. SSA4.19 TaxID=2919915 RepID=UPI001F4E6B80|nr:hypothetical protein [Chryseobacterium sp. SSA4.19]MCJ8155689.1 hypothetical protein [Chryseobacterium sp. SSA4.19]
MDKIQTIKDRILLFLEKKKIKKEAFYKVTGLSASNFKGIALKSDLGVEKVAKIITVYPELLMPENLNWLITGKGALRMALKEEDQQTADLLVNGSSNEKIGDLLANLYAQYNAQDKGLLFVQNQISRLEKKIDKQNKHLEEILSLMKSVPK